MRSAAARRPSSAPRWEGPRNGPRNRPQSRPCDSLANDMFVIRAEFGRQTFSPKSKWYQQYANLWGCYTNLCQWVGHYGDDDVALNNFNTKVAAIAL